MRNLMTMKLEQFARFSEESRCQLDELASGRRRTWPRKRDISSEGDSVEEVHLVLSGLAARYKDLPDGGRQITAFLIPGDLCDVEGFVLERMDHGVIALTETTCAIIAQPVMRKMLTETRELTEALWWSTMTDTAVLRERIVDHGQRDALERIAHLFYEMLIRYRMVGMTDGNAFEFPVTQGELADATGLTSVHVNRMMMRLRAEGLIEQRDKIIIVKDPAGLKRVARFNARYLHMHRTEAGDEEVAHRAGDLV